MTKLEKKELKLKKRSVVKLAKQKSAIFKPKSLFAIICIYFKENKAFLISTLIIFNFILFLVTMFSMSMNSEYGGKYIATAFSRRTDFGDEERKLMSIGGTFNNYIYGGLGLTFNVVIIAYLTSHILSSELEKGSIVFWISSSISKKNVIISKLYFIYFVVIINWLISLLYSIPTLLTAEDNDNIKFAIIKMFTHLFVCLIIASLAIYTSMLLSGDSDWYFILWIFICIYTVIMFSISMFFENNKSMQYLSIENIFSNWLYFNKEPISVTKNNYEIEIVGHDDPNYIQFGILFPLILGGLIYLNHFEIIRFWNKIEFNS